MVKLLYCGQGMMTLIEVYEDGQEKLIADHLALVDCGGDGGTPTDQSLDYIALKVKNQPHQVMEAVIISHQDTDHVCLLPSLADRLTPLGASVNLFIVGGLCWKEGARATLKDFAEDLGLDTNYLQWPAASATDYAANGKSANAAMQARLGKSVFLRLLSNAVTTGKGTPENRSSAVVAVDNGHYRVVLPGDATVGTMDYINKLPNIGGQLRPVVAVEVPHHGALETAVTKYRSRTPQKGLPGDSDDFDYTVLERFETTLKAERAGASAGPYNQFHHPMEEVMVRFETSALIEADHRYVSWFFNDQRWATWRSTVAIYSTVQRVNRSAMRDTTSTKVGDKAGSKFIYGDVIFRLAQPGSLRPEEMAEFRPRGTLDADALGEPVIAAPAP